MQDNLTYEAVSAVQDTAVRQQANSVHVDETGDSYYYLYVYGQRANVKTAEFGKYAVITSHLRPQSTTKIAGERVLMSKIIPTVFKRSLVAAAVVSVSACASLPSADLGGVGDGIARAGKATANVGRSTWEKTTYLLGFGNSRENSQSPSDDQLLIANRDVERVEPLEISRFNDDLLINGNSGDTSGSAIGNQTAGNRLNNPDGLQTPSQQDLIHEVASNETLWDIAKRTTGDANNWHVLADVNNLAQSAAVFPGQKLLVPSSMVKPGYDPDAIPTAPATIAGASDTDLVIGSNGAAADADSLIAESQLSAASIEQNATPMKLQDGETLWDFAKRTTGDATNWQQIASQNNFTEKQATSVRPGQTIQVPLTLVRDSIASAGLSTTEPSSVEPVTADTEIKVSVISDDDALSEKLESQLATGLTEATNGANQALETAQTTVLDTASDVGVDTGTDAASSAGVQDPEDLKIVEATYRSTDALDQPQVDSAVAQIVENDNIASEIMVNGTYYPKAVYNDADFSSSLLMRVSPGTMLQVSRTLGTWFEVETDKGIGYVHQRDVQ